MLFDKLRDNSKILVYIVVIAFAGGGLLWGVSGYFNNSNGSQSPQQKQTAYAQQGKQGNIAVVDGEEIPYKNYLQVLQRTQQQYRGQISNNQILELKSSVLNQLINRKLLLQKAKRDNLEANVTDKEVEEQLDKYVSQYANSKEEFKKLLEKNGQSLSGFKAQLRNGLKDQKLLQKATKQFQSDVEVSDAELKAAYKKATGEEATGDKFEEQKDKIKQQVKSQKQKQAMNKALEEYKKDVEIKINSAELRAYEAAKNGNFQQAINDYEQALEQNQNKSYLYANLAQAYQKQGDNAAALNTYKKAVEKSPENANLRLALGKFYNKTEKEEKAVKQLDKASELAGNDIMVHYQLQRLYKKMGYEKKAEAELKKVKEMQQKAAEQYKKQQQKLNQQQEK